MTNTRLSPEPTWVVQRRDIVEDLQRAFGRPPDDKVHAIVLFTDNEKPGSTAAGLASLAWTARSS